MMTGSKPKISRIFIYGLLGLIYLFWNGSFYSAQAENIVKTYIGSEPCKECHESEYENFTTYAKKYKSFKSVKIREKGLTDQELKKCFECHTTGYGKPGGFKSEVETPHLKNLSCEACHGPGNIHAETEDPEDIKGSLSVKECEVCHDEKRVAAFNYKPLIYGGTH